MFNNKIFLRVLLVLLSMLSCSAMANTAVGKVVLLQTPLNNDTNTIYFRLAPMPENVPQYFYIRHTGDSAGCTVRGSEKTTERAYALLLAASLSNHTVSVTYCIDSNGYALVNEHISVIQ